MTLHHWPDGRYEIRCDAPGCRATTATSTTHRTSRNPDAIHLAARRLLWIPLDDGRHVCPLHQAFNGTEWVPAPHWDTAA